jgi:hypothetical protein
MYEPTNRELALLYGTSFLGAMTLCYMDYETTSVKQLFEPGMLFIAFVYGTVAFAAISAGRYLLSIHPIIRYSIMLAVAVGFIKIMEMGANTQKGIISTLVASGFYFLIMLAIHFTSKLLDHILPKKKIKVA